MNKSLNPEVNNIPKEKKASKPKAAEIAKKQEVSSEELVMS